MHLPAKMAIWRKASDPGDPTGDVRVCGVGGWGGIARVGGLHLTEFTRISNVPYADTSSQSCKAGPITAFVPLKT